MIVQTVHGSAVAYGTAAHGTVATVVAAYGTGTVVAVAAVVAVVVVAVYRTVAAVGGTVVAVQRLWTKPRNGLQCLAHVELSGHEGPQGNIPEGRGHMQHFPWYSPFYVLLDFHESVC